MHSPGEVAGWLGMASCHATAVGGVSFVGDAPQNWRLPGGFPLRKSQARGIFIGLTHVTRCEVVASQLDAPWSEQLLALVCISPLKFRLFPFAQLATLAAGVLHFVGSSLLLVRK